jgi:hypothetical protein
VVDVLLAGGVVTRPARALLGAGPAQPEDQGPLHAQMRVVFERDPAAYAVRQEELGWLANALMAGATLDTRPFTTQEAADAVAATCSLGLECWPPAWRDGVALPDDFLIAQDLVTVFQVGWTVLHDDVCAHAVSALMDALATLPPRDRETETDLAALRATLRRHWRAGTAWQARDALDVLAPLDLPAWSALVGLIAECPVLPAAIDPAPAPAMRRRTFDPAAFTFISSRSQIAGIDRFLRTLPDALRA